MKIRLCLQVFSMCIISIFLPGCRYYCWITQVYNQGEKVPTPVQTVQQYWRAQHVYDQFSPLAHFDVLWLSHEVRAAYVQVYAMKHCLAHDRFHVLQEEQLQKNNRTVCFYLLSAVTASWGSDDLASKDAEWSICLLIDGVLYAPLTIKEIEIEPEYIMFFGKSYTHFKRCYSVCYNTCACNENKPIITDQTRSITLQFNRGDRRVCMQWCLDGHRNVIRTKLTDPNVLAYPLHCP